MPKIAVGDVELYYELVGNPDGRTVVFVNGLLTDTTSWQGHLPYFTDRYRCLVYDCRGQGQSDKPDQVYETARHTADLAGLVAALGIGRAHFVGLSNGGAAVLEYTAGHPAQVESAVVAGAYAYVDTILRVKLTSWVRAMEAGGSPLRFDVAVPWVWGGRFLDENYAGLLRFREKGANMPMAWAMNLVRGAMVHDIRARLGDVIRPVLAIVGEEDVLTPPRLAREIVAAVPRGECQVMPGLGHAVALEDVEGFSRRVLDFFARVEAGAR